MIACFHVAVVKISQSSASSLRTRASSKEVECQGREENTFQSEDDCLLQQLQKVLAHYLRAHHPRETFLSLDILRTKEQCGPRCLPSALSLFYSFMDAGVLQVSCVRGSAGVFPTQSDVTT